MFPASLPSFSSGVDSQVRPGDLRCDKMVTANILRLVICFSCFWKLIESHWSYRQKKRNSGLQSNNCYLLPWGVPFGRRECLGDIIPNFFKWPIFRADVLSLRAEVKEGSVCVIAAKSIVTCRVFGACIGVSGACFIQMGCCSGLCVSFLITCWPCHLLNTRWM